MILGCIFCGGVIEILFLVTGIGALWRWLKKKHNKKKCNKGENNAIY